MKKYIYIGLPILGVLFYLGYLYTATVDVVYSDYIRHINSYLPDVWNPDKFFVADVLTRIPINYLERIINLALFDYSVTFNRVLSVLSYGATAIIVGVYSSKQKISLGWFSVMMVFMFSLNKWEMLYNGTGWSHFMAFACFFYHYLVLDRVYGNEGKSGDILRLMMLPVLTTIFVAGPYCAIYSVTLLIAYSFIFVRNWYLRKTGRDGEIPTRLTNRQLVLCMIHVIWPLLLYLWSNSRAEYVYSNAVEGSIIAYLFQEPKFFLKFLLKGFASMFFGVEFINRNLPNVPGEIWCLLGLFLLIAYFVALIMNFYYGIYQKTIFPLMLLAGGGMNHLLVLATRWIFMPNDLYGMSSRYALQYQIGVLGIMLTFAMVYQKQGGHAQKTEARNKFGCPWIRASAIALVALILVGNTVTTVEEFRFGEMRKNSNLERKEKLLHFEDYTEEELASILEYSKPGKKEALQILKDNGWNIFRETR